MGIEIGIAKIDIEDIELVSKYNWYLNSDGYARNKKAGRMHNLIMGGRREGYVVDHRDNCRLNDRKYNLRWATFQENNRNILKKSNNTSGCTGVNFSKKSNKWRAYITVDKRQIHLGTFKDIKDAIKVRKQGEIKHFGEFRRKEKGEN